jgi:CheY-like chemotaxis protein
MQFRHAVKLGAVGQLAGGVAHDFNNLLTVITSYSGLLLAQLEQGDPMRGDVEQIGGAAKRAATVTRQLLAFSRQQMVRPQLLTLNEIVTGLESLLRRLVRENIEIVTSLDPELGLVEADPGQMEQVIANLVVNARDAMPEGGTLMIQTANAVFDGAYISRHRGVTMTPGQYALLVVSDTGTGMTPEVQARVFEPFYTTKAPGEGTGLGLATVYGIVKQSGGFVWLYGEPGRGTTFKVYLPFAKEATEPLARGKDHARDPGGSETILVVEDDAALRAAACRAIQAFGYHVLAASNGREALEICEQHDGRIHLIVTDVVMPEMSGGDLARQVAEHRPGIKVLLMSGYTRDATVRQGIVRDGRPFLDKPFTPDGLVERIREVLDSDMKGASG